MAFSVRLLLWSTLVLFPALFFSVSNSFVLGVMILTYLIVMGLCLCLCLCLLNPRLFESRSITLHASPSVTKSTDIITSYAALCTSPPPSKFSYDVFISFRGADTRIHFTDHLYAALVRKSLFTFRNDDGESIAPDLLKSIEESRYVIVVFSQSYADSAWCLDELAAVVDCMNAKRLKVLPVFYHVDPSDVRKQTGDYFGKAFRKHQRRYKGDPDKVRRWKQALNEVGSLSGWHLQDGSEARVIQEIVEKIFTELNEKIPIYEGLVGMDSHLREILSYLDIGGPDVRIIGIYGMTSIGRTIIARMVFNTVQTQFEGCSFVENIEKQGAVHLQEQLLSDLLKCNVCVSNTKMGKSTMRQRLSTKRVLLVLDGMEQEEQLEALCDRESFGPGSRIIITTRDQNLLREADVAYKVNKLAVAEALEFFYLQAFRKDQLMGEDCLKLFKEDLINADLGSYRSKNAKSWSRGLDRLKEHPPIRITNDLQIALDQLRLVYAQFFAEKSLVYPMQTSIYKMVTCLDLTGCSELDRIPDLNDMKCLKKLSIDGTSIKELSFVVGMKNLQYLSCRGCKSLSLLSCKGLATLSSLVELDLSYCNLMDGALLNDLGSLSSLTTLDLSGNCFVRLPESISQFSKRKILRLSNCKQLRSLAKLPPSLQHLSALDCTSLILNSSESGATSSTEAIPSSSSASPPPSKLRYDVFLSFRGANNFTDHIYTALQQKHIFTFRDEEELEKEESNGPNLLKAIEESRYVIVVFSQSYADSAWCLDELAAVVDCMNAQGLKVFPVFYHVDPSDVRKQKGAYGKAFQKHEERFKEQPDKVQRWKDALAQVCNLYGWDVQDRNEAEVIKEILQALWSELHPSVFPRKSHRSLEKTINHFSSGLESANFVVNSELVHQAWSAIEKQKQVNPNAEPSLYNDIQQSSDSNVTIIAFGTPAGSLQGQEGLVSSSTLKETNFTHFEYLCDKSNPSFSLSRAVISLFCLHHHDLILLKNKLVENSKSRAPPLIIITGQSVGGSVATLFTLWLLDSFNVSKTRLPLCITFGSPLLGDELLRRCVSKFTTWNSCFLHIASNQDPIPSRFLTPAGIYKPFGTFLLCSAAGCACFQEPDSILEWLWIATSRSSQNQDSDLGQEFFDYGQILKRLKVRALCVDDFKFPEGELDPLQASIITQLLAIGFPLTQNANNAIERMESHEHLLTQRKNVSNSFEKLSEMQINMVSLERYKKDAKRNKIGYYDMYKKLVNTSYMNVYDYKKKLMRYWEDSVAEEECKPHKEGDFFWTSWLTAGTSYRRMVEPLHIAEYYMKDNAENYIADERPRHFILLEKWWKEREKPEASQNNAWIRRQVAACRLNEDSCFWAHVEEAKISCNLLKKYKDSDDKESSLKKLKEFEDYVYNAIQNNEVSLDIFLEGSSFKQWWNKYEAIMGSSYCSSLMMKFWEGMEADSSPSS